MIIKEVVTVGLSYWWVRLNIEIHEIAKTTKYSCPKF